SSDLRHKLQRHETLHCWHVHSAAYGVHHHAPEYCPPVCLVIERQPHCDPVNGLWHIVQHFDKQIQKHLSPEFPSTGVRSSSSRTSQPDLRFLYPPDNLWRRQNS